MPLSTEVFVMVIFLAGYPFFHVMLRDSSLRGRMFFLLSYACLTLSNIFTVVEEFWLNSFFNICEHAFILLGSIMMFVAVFQMTARPKQGTINQASNGLKR